MNADARKHNLTTREIEVLRLVAEGLTNEEIAERLGTSTGTINSHVHNIFKKLQVKNRTLAAGWAIRNGLATR